MAIIKDSEYSYNTPDLISVKHEVVGIGTRLVGTLIDNMVLQIVVLCVVIVFAMVFSFSPPMMEAYSEISDTVRNLIIAALFLLFYIMYWGYHIYFEVFRHGRTPGKKLAGSRVVKMDGSPITFRDSLIRNLLRIVDALPVLYVVGVISHFVNENGQRLGDISAGTIVIREHGRSYLDNTKKQALSQQAMKSPTASNSDGDTPYSWIQLTQEEYELVFDFMNRKDSMQEENAKRVAVALANRIGEKYQVDPIHYKDSPIIFLRYLI